MKEFLAGWIVVQLLFIGLVSGDILYETDRGVYDCNNPLPAKWQVQVTTAVLPLILFTSSVSDKYCEEQKDDQPSR